MATINPFYRFEDAIQVGSLGERGRIVSLALDEIYSAINVSQVGQTLSQVLETCNGLAGQYNDDLNANFVVDCFYISDPPILYPVQIFIYDSILAVQYPLHKISLVLIIDPTPNQVTLSSAWFMGSIPANYNYSEPLCADELEAYNALTQYAQTNSAIFPKTYKFDSQTGIASSLVARLRPCKYDVAKGTAVRFPADTYARGARPNLQFPKLSSAGAYMIKLFNSLLPLALEPTTTLNDLYLETFKWVAPDGYFINRILDNNLPERMQIDVYSSTDGFALVVRDGNDFEFQRFYAPEYTALNLLSIYPANISLPYQPADFYKYGDIFYDFDFCEFNNCAYPAKESYLMPSKSGDEYQFNVLPYQSNVLPYESVDVGLFDKDFNLVQKIGTATQGAGFPCLQYKCSHDFTYLVPTNDIQSFVTEVNDAAVYLSIGNEWSYNWIFLVTNSQSEIITQINKTFRVFPKLNITQIRAAFTEMGITSTSNQDGITFTFSIENLTCGETYSAVFLDGWTFQTLFTMDDFDCVCQINESLQFESEVLIPAVKSDCYRFGLYKYERNIYGAEIEICSGNPPFPLPNTGVPYVFVISDNTQTIIKYIVVLPYNVITYEQVLRYFQLYFPNSKKESTTNCTVVGICGYNNTFGQNDLLFFGQYDFSTSTFAPIALGQTASTICQSTQGNEINEIYSFSNLISLDNSDCFSTMVQFWAESNAIAQGFEYYNDWHQQVRLGINGGGQKPIITESTYRQSNGVTRRPSNKQDLSIDLHTDFLDLETQSALVDATRHPNLVVDGRNIFVNGDIEVATIQDFTTQSSFEDLAQVKFSALIQGYQPKNSTCINC
jgi:hypothetical protein